jgi:hypothetical protein
MPRPLIAVVAVLLAWLVLAPPPAAPAAPAAQRFAAVEDLVRAEIAKYDIPAAAVGIVDGD